MSTVEISNGLGRLLSTKHELSSVRLMFLGTIGYYDTTQTRAQHEHYTSKARPIEHEKYDAKYVKNTFIFSFKS